MKKVLKILFWGFIVFNLLGLFIGNYFYQQAVLYDTRKDQNIYENAVNAVFFKKSEFDTISKEKVAITSDYGYTLRGHLLFCPDTTENTVILNHGLAASRWHMLGVAKIYLEYGFNLLVYDLRNHGESGGENVTYGFYEKHDLEKVVDFVEKRFPNGIIGIQGESMGAATSLQHATLNEDKGRVGFYVSDCAYSDLKQLFTHRLREDYGLPNLLILEYASLVSRMRAGFMLSNVSPIEDMKHIETPILFMHGGIDDFVPFRMSKEMFQQKSGPKQLYLTPGAAHSQCLATDSKSYKTQINNFLNQYVLENNGATSTALNGDQNSN